MAYPIPTLNGVSYFPIAEGWEPYHYEDEVAVVKLLGRDPALPDRNEVLQTNARGAQVSTFSALCETEAEADALVALWADPEVEHDDGTGAGPRDVVVTSARKTPHSWAGSAPVWIVTLMTRTVRL
ncbi:MAG TPA: hypothetical protein VGR85_03130 [Candidatus Limnocylindria bacterium]|jgi:hypothetical protein|nr:hypothetical protein [Candidatus Limnocylindria bacterium]